MILAVFADRVWFGEPSDTQGWRGTVVSYVVTSDPHPHGRVTGIEFQREHDGFVYWDRCLHAKFVGVGWGNPVSEPTL